MSQSFEGAQPQVVRGKHKYRGTRDGMLYPEIPEEEEGRNALNIMYDKRVFRGNTHNQNVLKKNLTPAQKEEQRIKEERERKKIEMIKQQLLEFKKSKNTTSPYDLRPGPPARIEVDLTYFLTEQGKQKPEESEVKIQTDVFQPKPPTPKYIPKKTGIDKITQIEDYDLFDYDVEVQPILNVLLNKSVEQACQEVEEEHEMEEIRKFKYQYHKRRELEDADWQQEVKKEIQRIKQKNRALENARNRRAQQIQTMKKLQCLNIAKSFLSTNFKKSMQHLADKKHWRDTFKDQLNVDFKDWMYNQIATNLENKAKSNVFKDGICTSELKKIGDEKIPIKKDVKQSIMMRAKSRQIESNDKRVVHFLFKPGDEKVKSKISPFLRKYGQYKEGTMNDDESKEKEAFDEHVAKILADEFDPAQDKYPIEYADMENFHCEITPVAKITKLSFSTADDPFYKASMPKYYPEAIIVDKDGKELGRVNPDNRNMNQLGMSYNDDIRDPVLKINDDRKICISLNGIKEPGTMIFLTVRENDLSGKGAPQEGEYDRAWFRLFNEETNQTIDYALIKNVEPNAEDNGYTREIPKEDDADESPAQINFLTYFHGILYLEEGNKWVFESIKDPLQAKDFLLKPVPEKLAELYARSLAESNGQKQKLADAHNSLRKNKEEARLAAAQDAAKKAAKTKPGAKAGKKGQKEADPEPVAVDEAPTRPESTAKEEVFDPTNLESFIRGLKHKIPRPILFGPIEFEGLDINDEENPWDREAQVVKIKEVLERSVPALQGFCQKGYRVLVKKRNLKRRRTLLKHARYLKNLEVQPIYPVIEVLSEGDPKSEDGSNA